jgi:hypothetical protein
MQTIATNTYNKVVIIKKGNLQHPFLQQQQQQQLQQQQEQQKIQPGIDKAANATKIAAVCICFEYSIALFIMSPEPPSFALLIISIKVFI